MVGRKRSSILIVDDTLENLELLVSFLEARGYEARPVLDGPTALLAAAADPPDLVLLDLMMPEMDGLQVCAALKRTPALAEIPVMFLSAQHGLPEKVRAFEAGAIDFITKPFHLQEISARIETHLELQRQRRLLAENHQRLLALERTRDELVHLFAHDLRSPLMGMTMFLEGLEAKVLPYLQEPDAADLVEAITTGHRVERAISSLLDVSRLEAARMPLKPEVTRLRDVVDEGVRQLGVLVRRRSVGVVERHAELTVRCDIRVTSRVVANLVANAVKYSPPDAPIEIELDASDAIVQASVHDEGPGIPLDQRERIFEKFAVVEKGTVYRSASTGLGLTFCKLAIEAQGGRIGVREGPRRGSTFWFTLPSEPRPRDAGAPQPR
ncbi:response regulator [Myxococcota bacterium]|nr:response regulator [Myxococcota bacterium]